MYSDILAAILIAIGLINISKWLMDRYVSQLCRTVPILHLPLIFCIIGMQICPPSHHQLGYLEIWWRWRGEHQHIPLIWIFYGLSQPDPPVFEPEQAHINNDQLPHQPR